MQILDLDGSAFERGLQQGTQMKEAFHSMLSDFFSSEIWTENKPGFIPNGAAGLIFGILGTTQIKKPVRRLLPLQFERIKGLGKGLGTSEGFAFGIQFLEILFCMAGKSLKAPVAGGCTQVHAQPRATAVDRPLSGRNYDFPNLLRPYQIIRRETPAEKDRLSTTTVTQAPLSGAHHGINEAGLMVSANNARLWKGRDFKTKGVPYLLILMEILETCRTVSEAAGFLTRFPERTNAGFFGMMDKNGDCCVVEFTASRFAIRKPDASGVIAQTNHYHEMKDANLPDGTYWTVKGMEGLEYAKSTKARFEAADRLIHEAAGRITPDTLKAILSDHSAGGGTGTDCTVCCHGDAGSTLSSIIADVRDRKMWVSDGQPCTNEFVEVPFRYKT
jgi:hypothetical protein